MHVDLFMEFASPPAGGRGAREVFEDGLALARAADAAGLGAVWLAEHHFLGGFCNAAAPDMLLAAMARETERIKLGFASAAAYPPPGPRRRAAGHPGPVVRRPGPVGGRARRHGDRT